MKWRFYFVLAPTIEAGTSNFSELDYFLLLSRKELTGLTIRLITIHYDSNTYATEYMWIHYGVLVDPIRILYPRRNYSKLPSDPVSGVTKNAI